MSFPDSRFDPPEEIEIPTVYKCTVCNHFINVGEEYVSIDSDFIHKDCFEDLSTDEILDIVGGTIKLATDDDVDDRSDELYESRRDEALLDELYD